MIGCDEYYYLNPNKFNIKSSPTNKVKIISKEILGML